MVVSEELRCGSVLGALWESAGSGFKQGKVGQRRVGEKQRTTFGKVLSAQFILFAKEGRSGTHVWPEAKCGLKFWGDQRFASCITLSEIFRPTLG